MGVDQNTYNQYTEVNVYMCKSLAEEQRQINRSNFDHCEGLKQERRLCAI
jgi:hypothetical protein